MTLKQQHFDVEWWIVSKRTIYTLVLVFALLLCAGGVSLYVWLYGNPFKHIAAQANAPAGARFVSFDGDVRVVRAQTRETLLARGDTQLYPGDVVQTQADGRARILLADGSTLLVRPNSVVTIRDNTSADGNRTNVRVAVARGLVNVRTEQQTEGSRNIVETPLTRNNIAAQTGASFGVREDNTEDIRVTTGAVDTTTRGGEHTTLQAGEYVAFNQSGAVKSRERLLAVPAPAQPRDLEKIPAGTGGAASVTLRWQRPATGATGHYRVEVATSPFFVAAGKVIERDQLEANEFSVGELRPGVYFWRVRAVAQSGQTSEWSEAQKFTITVGGRDGEGVAVSGVTFEYLAGSIYIVRGRTQAGNSVSISGRGTIAEGDGSFQLQISVPAGTRELYAEVEDQRGNRARTPLPFTPGKS
jgi:hypothetical protein